MQFLYSSLVKYHVVLSTILIIQASQICHDLNRKLQLDNFATKTGYFYTVKNSTYKHLYETTVSNCSVLKVWFMSRHGTRYPVGDDYKALKTLDVLTNDIQYNFNNGRGCLTEEDIFEYKRWLPPYEARDKGQLHSTGAEELFSMGQYWRDLFPSLFATPYNTKNVKIEFTTRNRTGQSAYHFLSGMYGEDVVGRIKLPKPYSPNFKLRFYKSCPTWLNDVYRNPQTYEEVLQFERTDHFLSTSHAISERLGFVKPLTSEQIISMYNECRYEMAWWPVKESIWCRPFTKHDLQVIEFHQDLKYYYEDSYGTPLNHNMACETASDLLSHFESTFSKKDFNNKQSCLYFSHDKAILHFFTTLGLFKLPHPLTHADFLTSKDRSFRTSRIASFASNLAFALFKCSNDYKVVFFFQGYPLIFDSACTDLFCNYSDFKEFLVPIKKTCNLSELCQIHDEL